MRVLYLVRPRNFKRVKKIIRKDSSAKTETRNETYVICAANEANTLTRFFNVYRYIQTYIRRSWKVNICHVCSPDERLVQFRESYKARENICRAIRST